MQPSFFKIFGIQTLAELDRIKLPTGKRRLFSAPATVTNSLVFVRYFPASELTSFIDIQLISPPKYLGSPLGLGDAPLITSI